MEGCLCRICHSGGGTLCPAFDHAGVIDTPVLAVTSDELGRVEAPRRMERPLTNRRLSERIEYRHQSHATVRRMENPNRRRPNENILG
jgi:hypothetical protein